VATEREAPTAPGDRRIVVVGGSLAGIRAAEALRGEGFAGELTVLGEESHYPPYDRPPLSKQLLADGCDPESLRLRVHDELAPAVHPGRRAVALDPVAREVTCAGGDRLSYDGLVIATGAAARTLDVDPRVRERTYTLRTIDDGLRLRAALAGRSRVAVLGAGFIGCEVAATLRSAGRTVTVIDSQPVPMLRALGPDLGEVVADLHRRHGVQWRLGVPVAGTARDGDDVVVSFEYGEPVRAEVLVVAIGAAPATGWLAGSGLSIDDGILCDEFGFAAAKDATVDPVAAVDPVAHLDPVAHASPLAAADPVAPTGLSAPGGFVVAAGDVARWYHPVLAGAVRIEHWTHAVGQAQAAARNLLARMSGRPPEPYTALPYFWSDQYDWKLQLVGTAAGSVVIEEGTVAGGKFVAAYRRSGQLVGALCVNSPARLGRWRQSIVREAAQTGAR
jgi:NADPH-dependent 2,4-dienoyl-CoA reductase/sulfur reductase-like enzyme